MQLIGREPELVALNVAWGRAQAGNPQLVAVWGRRRVGKTFLLTHFAHKKRTVYFTATRQDQEAAQLARFADRLREQLGEEVAELLSGPFADWETALRFVVRLAEQQPLLVVIDEAPRLFSTRGNFADLVSAVWENRVRDQKLMLVLTGSAVAVMEEMLGPHGGLHRRPTLEKRLDPFSIRDGRAFLPDLSASDYVQAYAACGGYPLHLTAWERALSVAENLHHLAYSPGGLLIADALDILSEDLDWRGGYERVLAAIGSGARRRSKIGGRAGQRIDYTLDRLRRAGYVRSLHPLGESSRDPLYEIADTYLAFWFEMLRDDVELIDGGQGTAIAKRTSERWQRHIGRVFEALAREHTVALINREQLPTEMIVGRWWRDEVCEVDVLGLIGNQTALVGESRWQAGPPTKRDIAELHGKLTHVPNPIADPELIVWTRTGGASDAVHIYSAEDALN